MLIIHLNSHFAIGVIIASIFNFYIGFNFFEFGFIILFSFICDFDIFFSKYAKNENHRMLITHSIIPSILIILFGFLFNWPLLIFSGLNYCIHIIIDTFDWGTNFFYFGKKQIGLKLLFNKDEFANILKQLSNYKNPHSYFDEKYYGNKTNLVIEALIFILMLIIIFSFAIEFIFIIFLYFPFLGFHLSRHIILKKKERANK